jgi:hypothetical protein
MLSNLEIVSIEQVFYLLQYIIYLTPKVLQWPNFGHCCFG